MSFLEQVVIITGASGGLGKSISKVFAQEGARVVLVDINKEKGEQLCREIESLTQQKPLFIKTDVTSSREVKEMIKAVNERFKKINVLINNAGITHLASIENISEEEWDHVISVNLKGTFLCSKYVIPVMKRQKSGRIINMGSLVAKNGGIISGGVYSVSKGGVHSLTYALARELAQYNITVNAVAPGPIHTEMITSMPKEKVEQMIQNIPLKRLGNADEVAHTIKFLASKKASFITGEIIDINGGIYTD